MAATKRPGFMIFHEDCMRLSLCTNEQRGALLWALYEYSNEGKSPATDDAVVYAMFDVMSKALDRARKSYENRSVSGKENNAKRSDRSTNSLPTVYQQSTNSLPNAFQSDANECQTRGGDESLCQIRCELSDDLSTNGLPNVYQHVVTSNLYPVTTNNEEERSTGTTGGKPPARARFVPPTIDEVDKHCRERGNNIDAEYFCAYYDARGWELSKGKKMTSWKSCIVTWEKRDKSTGNAASKKPASQPLYSPMMTRVEELLNDD